MKKAALMVFAIVISLIFQTAMGDVKIVNQVKNVINGKEQGSGENTSYYKEDRARMEAPGAVSIIRLDKGVMWVINESEKTYMEMTAEQMGALGAFMKSEIDPEIEKTEETKKIGKYECTKIVVTIEMMGTKTTTEVWATEDIKPDKTVIKFTEKLVEVFKDSPQMQSSNKMMQELYDMNLFPVQTITKAKMMGMSSESTTLLKSISTEDLDDSLFEIPDDYEKQEMPSIPGMGGKGAVKSKGVIKGKAKDVIKGKAK